MTSSPPQHGTHLPGRRIAAAAILALGVLLCRVPRAAGAQDDPGGAGRLGMSIRIDLPITDRTTRRVQQFVDKALERARRQKKRPVLIFEFRVPKDEEKFAGQTEFTDALKLARLLTGERLASVHTVAYVPRLLPGHAVLVAAACEEIMMPGDAQLGPVGVRPEAIEQTERIAYGEIAGRRKTIPTEVAKWLLDPSQEVLVVQTELGRECVTPEQLEELRKKRTISKQPQPLREWIEGQPGQLSGDEAWRLDIVTRKPATRQDVAKWLDLPPDAMDEDPSLVEQWKAVLVKLEGRIDQRNTNQIKRLIKDEIRLREVNFICVWIDSPGGSLTDSIDLASFLADNPDLEKVRTVAYIPRHARGDAALIALACDHVVMHSGAELGGPRSGEDAPGQDEDGGPLWASPLSPQEIESAKEAIRDPNGPWKTRPWSLLAAMIDPNLEVFRCTRPNGDVGYFCNDELNELERNQPGAEKWQKGVPVTRPGEPFLTNGTDAVRMYRLANLTAENPDELKEHYGLEELRSLKPGWVDELVVALASPSLSFLLLAIAFMAAYAELHSPGIGIGGFVATVCFLLFFWSHALAGDVEWLEILLFVAGIACLLLEIFVLPGFGIFGLGGGLLVLASLILASQTYVLPQDIDELQRALWPVAAAMAVVIVAAVLLRHWLPRTPVLSQMLLEPPVGQEAEDISRRESLVDLEGFVGNRGTTTTQLTPSGKARFGDMLVDVITDGEVIQRGAQIEVVEVQGNRVIVKAVDS